MVNVGSIDRALRFVLGAVLLATPFVPPLSGYVADFGVWKYAIAAAGVVMLGTAVFRFCPAYTLFGVRTCELKKS
ncbi:Protein of unknown function DUF2892 [Rhabdaerophilaceae bacterium]